MTFTVCQLAGFGEDVFAPHKITQTELDEALDGIGDKPSDDDVVAVDKLKQAFKGTFLEAIGFRGKPSLVFLLKALDSPPPQDTTRWFHWNRYSTLVYWLELHRPPASRAKGTWV